jgi:uncharacterized Tic20 family protein
MDIFGAIFTYQYLYSTNKSEGEIRSKLIEITQSNRYSNGYLSNLTGSVSGKDFKLYRKSGSWYIRSWDSEPVTIYGQIIKNESDLVDFEVEIKTNFIFPLFIIILFLVQIAIILLTIKYETVGFLIFASCFLFMTILWTLAYFIVKYYKNEFQKTFDFEENNEFIGKRIRF